MPAEVYRRTAVYLKKHVLVVFKVFVITILQRTAYFFTTYFIYRSFGLKELVCGYGCYVAGSYISFGRYASATGGVWV